MSREWRELASGMGFTEGPVQRGSSLIFTSINRGMLYIADLRGGVAEFAEVGGGPNGLACGAHGEIFVAQNGGHIVPTKSRIPGDPSIQCVSADGAVRLVSSGYFAPNDCAFGPDGRLYFTDPHGSTKSEHPLPGRVWALDVASGERELVLDRASHPNGLAFGADPDELYIAETLRHRIIRLRRSAHGWREAGVFAELPVGEPDGLAFDIKGRLWVAASAGDVLVVFEANGTPAEVIELGPSFPTNLCFAGPDLATLVVTAPKGGRVLAADVDTPGLPLLRP